MKKILAIVLILCSAQLFAQTSMHQRHLPMIHFLLEHKELTKTGDSLASYEDAMYERMIWQSTAKGNAAIYFFGSNSAHGKKFIALCDKKHLVLLSTIDMASEFPQIIYYLKQHHVYGNKLYKLLQTISLAYQHNEKNYLPVEEEH